MVGDGARGIREWTELGEAVALLGEDILLRAYLLNTDHAGPGGLGPTYERLVRAARHEGLAGATVLKGILGYGSRGWARPSDFAVMSAVPVVVEIVDRAERILAFMSGSAVGHLRRGMMTLERAGVMMYRRRGQVGGAAGLRLLPGVTPLSTVPEFSGRREMVSQETGVLLRIFAGESDRFEGRPLHEAVVRKARELGLAGATVLRGAMGFGANSVLHTNKVVDLSTDLPIVIEIVDSAANVEKLLPHLEVMVKEGMITMEHVRVVMYRHNPADG